MKTRFATFLLAVSLITGCQRGPSTADSEAERQRAEQLKRMDERIAKLQDLEKEAADRKLAESEQRAANSDEARRQAEQDRLKAERERLALQKERDQLASRQQDAEARAREAERQAQETAARADQERAERTVDLFYTALQPQGDWFDVDQYGYVWQPSVASDPRWRPYTDGRWVFTEYGWFWKSNESFGWAAYHYGRWVRLRRIGWVWVPGTEWGPAWVSWRRSDRYVGWAPLPPDAWSGSGFTAAVDSYYDIGPGSYTFVPVEEVGEPTYVGRVVAPEQNVTIVNQTVNVTNVTYKKVENNTVVYNAGPDITVVNARAKNKIQQLKVERQMNVRDPKDFGRSEQKGTTLFVAGPNFAKAKSTEKPQKLKESVKAPEVEKGWGNLDQAASNQARQRMKAEATESEEKQRRPMAKPLRPAELPGSIVVKPTPGQPAKAEPVEKKEKPDAAQPPASRPAKAPEPVPAPPLATPKPPAGVPEPPMKPIPAKSAKEPVAQPEPAIIQPGKPVEDKPARSPEAGAPQKGRKIRDERPSVPDRPIPADAGNVPGAPPSDEPRPDSQEGSTPNRKLPRALKNRPEGPGRTVAPVEGLPAPTNESAPAAPAVRKGPKGEKGGEGPEAKP